jgi:hypothetical protein
MFVQPIKDDPGALKREIKNYELEKSKFNSFYFVKNNSKDLFDL